MENIENKFKGLIYSSLINIIKDCKPIPKDQMNEQQHFKYRGIDKICDEIQPLLGLHGVFIVPHQILDSKIEEKEVVDKYGKTKSCIYERLSILFRMYAADGSFIEGVGVGSAIDYGDKSTGKAQTFAYKAFLNETFCIPYGQEDPDASSYELIKTNTSNNQPSEININPIRENLVKELKEIVQFGDFNKLKERFEKASPEELECMGDNLEKTKEYFNKMCRDTIINESLG